MPERVSVAEAKRRFSELVNRAGFGRERFIIERHGKPVGAIVGYAELQQLESGPEGSANPGLIVAVGALAEFDDFEDIMADVIASRRRDPGREVALE